MTAALHRDFLQMGVTNGLARPGGVTMLGSPVDLAAVDRDTYLVAGITDHLCPWQSCYRSTQLLSGSKRFVLSTSGHIAAMVSPPGNEKARYQEGQDCPGRPSGVAAARGELPRLVVAGLHELAGRTIRRGDSRAHRTRWRRAGADRRRAGDVRL
jgi:poly(3-hydroxyalkanoate) synthetase